ncbi:MAG TPA: hypothetical protein VK912_03415 [Longimicrobiales bacterium]|nr:hypothetical protein [Longimicrobiales bacterium]
MHALLNLALVLQVGAALPADSVEALRDRARQAEARFERLSRRLAPLTWTGNAGTECDEIVGRFCLRFDSTTTRPARVDDEAARTIDARREAVEAIRRYFSAAPAERSAAGPLVRLLIRDGRAAEAASAAGAFAALSGDTLWGELLQGLATHWAGTGIRAERHFLNGLARLDADERRHWLDPSWLLDPAERRLVRRMSETERAEYERRFWLMADPFWLTPENERWNEHVARHVEADLLADVPLVAGMVRWGADLDELTVRYGVPTTRARQAAVGSTGGGMVEYWDTAQRAYAPARPSAGVPTQPDPGERPLLYAARARSAYTVQGVQRVLEPAHQVTRFLRGDSVLVRVDAAMEYRVDEPGPDDPDAPARNEAGVRGQVPAPPHAGLFLYDSAFTRRVGSTVEAQLDGDTARAWLFARTAAGTFVYSIELLGDSSATAGRARYRLPAQVPPAGPVLSDILTSRPFRPQATPDAPDDPRLRPFTSLVFEPGDTVGLYAEVYRLTAGGSIDIEVALEDASSPSLLGRFARWIGRGVGLLPSQDEARVGWRGESSDARFVVALNVPLPDGRHGLHDLVLRASDPVTGQRSESRRRILIR